MKGQVETGFIVIVFTIALAGAFTFFTINKFYEIKIVLDESDFYRSTVNLAQVLVGTKDALAFSDKMNVYRGILDKETMFDERTLNDYNVSKMYYEGWLPPPFIEIKDFSKDKKWTLGTSLSGQYKVVNITLPVAIRYDQNDISMGKIRIELLEKAYVEVTEGEGE